jgi:anti-sigma B factor antagonist
MTVQPDSSGDLDVVPVDRRSVIRLEGVVDVAAAPRLRAVLVEMQARGLPGEHRRPPVVDLSAVTYIDAVGLGVLLAAARRARSAGHDLELRAPDARTMRLLEATMLVDRFHIEPTLAAARRAA